MGQLEEKFDDIDKERVEMQNEIEKEVKKEAREKGKYIMEDFFKQLAKCIRAISVNTVLVFKLILKCKWHSHGVTDTVDSLERCSDLASTVMV